VACEGHVLENSNPPFPNYQTLQQFLIPHDKGKGKRLLVYAAVNNFKGKNTKAIMEDGLLTVIPQSYVLSSSQTSNTS
jgi:hypothetical protein